MCKWLSQLQKIGEQLDAGVFPTCRDGGLITPRQLHQSPDTTHEVPSHERKRSRRPETGPGRRPAGRKGTPGRSRTADPGAPFIGSNAEASIQAQVTEAAAAYPGTKIWRQDGGMWLLTKSALLHDVDTQALFLTAISYGFQRVRSWGFWDIGVIGREWIGPRHTNFPDGSVCAFEPRDHTWSYGEPLIQLLDIYSLWALRHLYLKYLGRWPGPQAVAHPYERLTEMNDDELCGCGNSGRLYRDCCKDRDITVDKMRSAVNFSLRTGGTRRPPDAIYEFFSLCSSPPSIHEIFGDTLPGPVSPGSVVAPA